MSGPSRPERRGRSVARRGVRSSARAAGRLHQIHSERRAAADLDRIGAGGGPIVVGPWVSEVGFELLYWVPLLRWALARRAIAPERVTVLTRGGAACWYREFATSAVELLDLLTPEEYRDLTARRVRAEGGQKQLALTEMDAEILQRAGAALDPDAELVHPSVLYRAFRYYWSGRSAVETVAQRLRFATLPPVSHPATGQLPGAYVAVKAYHSDALPDTAHNRRFVAELVRRLSERSAVVLLSAGIAIDDHEDVAVGAGQDVLTTGGLFGARDNLAAQSAIVAGADALLCSYGGFSYLGPLLDVPTLAFSSVRSYNPLHLTIAQRAAHELGARYVTADTGDAGALDGFLASATGGSAQ